jgi:hypothetical protein
VRHDGRRAVQLGILRRGLVGEVVDPVADEIGADPARDEQGGDEQQVDQALHPVQSSVALGRIGATKG